jgi:hypothetical protein
MRTERLLLSNLRSALVSDIDLLIMSASFEGRCKAVADAIDPMTVRRALVAQNRNHAEFHDNHAKYLLDRFGERATLMELDTSDPLRSADNIVRILRECATQKLQNVVIDISTFTREGFLILFRALNLLLDESVKKQYIYARAEEYAVGSKLEDKWLSRGIADVRSVLGYPGAFEPSRRLHLIVLVGFEYDRVAELLRRCEPSIISLGQALASEKDSAEHVAMHHFNYERLRNVFGEVDRFDFPGYDPEGARDAILRRLSAREGYNTMIAPMNTKLSTMGAALAAMLKPEMQIVYAQAILYNVKDYSKSGDACYVATSR